MLELVNPKVGDVVRFGLELLAFRARFGLWNTVNAEHATALAVERFCTPRGRRGQLEPSGLLDDLRRFAKNAEVPADDDVRGLLDAASRTTVHADGLALRVYRWTHARPRGRVLFAHGWEGYAFNFGPSIDATHSLGFDVVAFDQIAHGESEGRHSSLPEFVWGLEAVLAHEGPFDLAVGHSLGAAAILQALCRESLRAQQAVVIAPFADMNRLTAQWSRMNGLGASFGPRLLSGIEGRYDYPANALDPAYIAGRVRTPVTIIHDRGDPIVPIQSSRRLAEASSMVELEEIEGAGHIGALFHPQVSKVLERCLA